MELLAPERAQVSTQLNCTKCLYWRQDDSRHTRWQTLGAEPSWNQEIPCLGMLLADASYNLAISASDAVMGTLMQKELLPPKFGPTSNSEFVPSPVYVTDFPHALHRFALNPTYVIFTNRHR